MKKNKLLVIIVCCLVLLALPLAVYAQESADIATEDEIAPDTDMPGISDEDTVPPANEEDKVPVTEMIVGWLGEKSGDIFCILTFVGSLIIAYFYKKGLLPVLSSSLSNISGVLKNGVCGIESAASSMSDNTQKSLSELGNSIIPALDKIKNVADSAKQMEQYIKDMEKRLNKSDSEREVVRSIMEGQMDLFYGFFMAVNLPQYQKDLLGQTYSEMKAKIKGEYRNEA